jgi:hypothetical protein
MTASISLPCSVVGVEVAGVELPLLTNWSVVAVAPADVLSEVEVAADVVIVAVWVDAAAVVDDIPADEDAI